MFYLGIKMASSKEISEKLAELYFDGKSGVGYSSPERLYRRAKKSIPNLTRAMVEYFFTTREVPSRFRKTRNKFLRTVFITRKARQQFGMDLADLRNLAKYNKNYGWINVITDIFTRQIISLTAQKTKTSAETAESIKNTFLSNPPPPKIIYSDKGTEFEGACRAVYKRFSVLHQTSMDFEQKVAPTERCILEVKRRLFKQMAHENSHSWTGKLDSVMESYNNAWNRDLKMTPNQAADPQKQSRVFYNTITRKEDRYRDETILKPEKFSVGNFVRIRLNNSMFSKTYVGAYSQALYVITNREIRSGLPVYHLKEFLTGEPIIGLFYPEEMVLANVRGLEKAPEIEHIFGRRMNNNREEVQVKLKNEKNRRWIEYTDLIPQS
jgi:hypothetical protein